MEEMENPKQIEVLESVKEFKPELVKSCYAVGLWLWAEFKQRLNQEELEFLKENGFRWNPQRKVWQNSCGVTKRQSSGDPRKKYPIVRFED